MKNTPFCMLFIILFSLTIEKQVFGQFVQLQKPCNSQGFKTIWCGQNQNLNTIYIHQTSYPAYRSTDGGQNWTQMSQGPNQIIPNGCGFIKSECYNAIDFRKSPYFLQSLPCFANQGIAVGNNGKILETIDGGDSWDEVALSPGINIPTNINFTTCKVDVWGGKFSVAASNTGSYALSYYFLNTSDNCYPITNEFENI